MKEKYKISVIVPVYNAEKYLSKCIKSILDQTIDGIEIIIVNDGSTDNSLQIAKELAKINNNIKIISQENKGPIVARIEGYKVATGMYIGFVDNDDFLENNMYEELYNNAIDKNADIVICNYKFYPKSVKNKKKWFNEYKGIVDDKFVNKNNLLWNKIVKKSYLEKINIIELLDKIGESAYTIALIKTEKIVTINKELYNYRVGQKSLSSSFENVAWHEKCVEKAIIKLDIIKNTDLEDKWSSFFQYSIFYNMLKMLLVAGYNSDKELYIKYKKKIQIYKKNKYCLNSFRNEYGKIKSFIVLETIFRNYYITRLLSKFI